MLLNFAPLFQIKIKSNASRYQKSTVLIFLMQASTLFYLFIFFLLVEFLLEKYLDWLNAKHFKTVLPEALSDVYDPETYQKSQAYKQANYHFELLTSTLSFVILLGFLFLNGFAWLDHVVAQITDNSFWQSLIYFGILLLASSLLNLPLTYYQTFVIEEKFGFNQSTRKLFFIDQLKSLFLSLLLTGLLLAAFLWFYHLTPNHFWLYAWALFAFFVVFINLFYTSLIVPLFNKLTPLPDGDLKKELQALAQKTHYNLDKIYVIDGSKRSSKANAYFSGFGPKKKVVLYDTLIKDLSPDEITAVLAHEIGHYKRRHILYNLALSILTTGLLLYLLSWVIDSQTLAQALGVSTAKFHINLIAFALLFTPVSFVLGLFTNRLSRKFEYQADAYAKQYHNAKDLITGLKKLSRKSLSNLTPHPWYVWAHYSHPTLLQRIKALNLPEKRN